MRSLLWRTAESGDADHAFGVVPVAGYWHGFRACSEQ